MSTEITRRKFLQVMGWSGVGAALSGCDMPTTVTLKEGDEDVVSYLSPEEYAIPGIGVWYASTCLQCPAGCGVHGRVREGRVLKLEGNPESPINYGKLCQMGQAGLQGHYNPDRITRPMMRKNGALAEVSWDAAWESLEQVLGAGSGLSGDSFAWFTGTVSGHQAVLLAAHLDAMGSRRHYTHEVINDAVMRAVNQDIFSDPMPRYRLEKARLVVSFGADFLGTWLSPVHFATKYAEFRSAPRGMLVQIEPKMTLTGGNADLWVPVRPGAEGALALGIANALINVYGVSASHIPAAVRNVIAAYDLSAAEKASGVSGDQIVALAALLNEKSPSLVLAGDSAAGHAHGYQSVAAIQLLNILLNNVGRTIEPSGIFPFDQMAPRPGRSRDLTVFAEAADNRRLEAVCFYGANPVYSAPDHLRLASKLANIPFKVAFAQFPDETALSADLVIPIASPVEDWGTHIAAYQPREGATFIEVQQPLMEKLHKDTPGFGDVLLRLLKARGVAAYQPFDDYYAYLNNAFAALPAGSLGGGAGLALWQNSLQKGIVKMDVPTRRLQARAVVANLPDGESVSEYPYHLVPSPRLGLWDGRHANLPWLQEAPDQISKVVWDSWAEIHPKLAAKLDVREGDYIRIASGSGSLEAKVYIHKGVHPEVIAVPLGQGHEEYGRYAKGRGVNPLKILDPSADKTTGELALYSTRVSATRVGRRDKLVKFGGSEVQLGRKLAATVTADLFRRTEGGGTDVA